MLTMLKKLWSKILAVIIAIGFVMIGSSSTEAASLKTDTKMHTAVIVVEDFTHKDVVRVTNLSGIKKMSTAIEWIENNASGRNLRFISIDLELLESWKKAANEATRKAPKEIEREDKQISEKSKKALKQGTKYSFELKGKKSSNKWSVSDADRAVDTVRDFQRVLRY